MKAYKGSYNGKCKGKTFEVGKTYTHDEKIEMCKSGFHFCLNAIDVLQYYPYKKDFVLFEIEVKDGNFITEGNKSVTKSFKVLRKVPKKEYEKLLQIKLDSKGKVIWYKDSNGFELNWKYDSKGKVIWYKDSTGFEQNWKYDSKGNQIWYKNSNGFEENWKYDSKGNHIWYKNSNGFEQNWKQDSKGNQIWCKDSNGFEQNWKYDSKGKVIWYKDSTGDEWGNKGE